MKFHTDKKFYYIQDQFINYREIGDGEITIIFIHGFGASSRTWDDVIPYIELNKYHLILVDLIGAGFSSSSYNSDFSMSANADVIIKFIKFNNFKNYILVGHSFGGGVILDFVLKITNLDIDKPKAIILIDTAAYNTGIPFFVEYLRIPIVNKLVVNLIPSKVISKYVLERIYFDKKKVTEEKIGRYAYFFSIRKNNQDLLKIADEIIPKNYNILISKYKTIVIPTLIVWGRQDTVLSIDGGKMLAIEIPNSRFITIDKCGHNTQEEQPEKLVQEIKFFLKSIL